MVLSLTSHHKKHLKILASQPQQTVADFCRLSSEYIHKGANNKLYNSAASKLNVSADVVQCCVLGLVNLVLLATRHQLTETEINQAVLALGLSQESADTLTKFCSSSKTDIFKICNIALSVPHYYNLEWRFEVQLASRALKCEVVPLITLDLTFKTLHEGGETETRHCLLQTDPTNLLHLVNELENALNEATSRYSRKVQRILNNYTLS